MILDRDPHPGSAGLVRKRAQVFGLFSHPHQHAPASSPTRVIPA